MPSMDGCCNSKILATSSFLAGVDWVADGVANWVAGGGVDCAAALPAIRHTANVEAMDSTAKRVPEDLATALKTGFLNMGSSVNADRGRGGNGAARPGPTKTVIIAPWLP